MSPNGSDRSSRRPVRRKLLQALAAGLVLATATGCTSKDFPRLGMPTPVTEEAPRILSLWQGSWAAALATGVLVWGLIIWAVIFHRRSRTKIEVPAQTRYNMPIEALYTVVPIIIVSVLFYFTARDENALLKTSKKPDHVINVVGYQWSWGFNYMENVDGNPATPQKTAKEISAIPKRMLSAVPKGAEGVYEVGTPGERNPQNGNPGPTLWLPKGESVQFILTSRDVIHSFWVIPFLMKMDVIPGHTNRFEVTPNREGTFRGKCAELCGVDHSRMLFNVKVVSPERYQQHLKDLAKKGQTGYIPAGIAQTDAAKNAETKTS
ncbi:MULTISPECIES: aa3-type cytochrome oxidase subunit II [Streptomyces]|uniref:cytochrome-c oxidase n=2 Tax=Streptomyces TaxID=1883 RepID=A0ABT9KQ76_9ACTN|nr:MULTISPECIES: cytochrome c oxidase subunit II [Streptomyces]MBW8090499.1 cytochrome c oxidase subunit II [Streptomyces hygroscopicus subsp. hygroscopicus]MCO8308305.1 cytochrome c oxidase subunit II [Streptomyces sp. RKCA744]MDN3057755.1 cytochrome c oxidase subunit II [Streptomyces sp. SRF1]MDP9610591.1 cytochrome c oxidase subunit 2 [Streptomyces demainii]GHJ28980.1 putative cytochrome c oxidase subunit 2 [Streptomyces hygroscopicus]